jgi:probable phosphoglycerate mutase
MNQRKLIYLIRHGQTNYNKEGIVQGSGIDMPLNELGQQQANLFHAQYKHVEFKYVFTSNLIRTQQSVANFIADGVPHVALNDLREISWGELEGMKQGPVQQAQLAHVLNEWQNENYLASVPGGENAIDLQKRLLNAMEELVKYDASNVLVCMHGRAMKALLCGLLNEPLSKMEEFKHSNLCLYILAYENGKFKLLEANQTAHLN